MRRRARPAVIVAALAAALAACAEPSIPIDQLDGRMRDALCAQAVGCGDFDTVARCVAAAGRAPLLVTPSRRAAVAAGLVVYDGVQAAVCVDQVATASCNRNAVEHRAPSAMCRGIFRADRLLGDQCAIDDECASHNCSAFCLPGMCCPGVCDPPANFANLGEDCSTYPCGPNGWCGPGQVCMPLLPRDMPCANDAVCDWGLTCVGTCQPPPDLGQPCLRQLDGTPVCGPTGRYCEPTTLTCQGPLPEGAACDPIAGGCQAGWLECDVATHRCAPLPRVGERCHDGRCAAGAFCKSDDLGGLCLPQADDGSPCSTSGPSAECASGLCGGHGLCIEPAACT